MIPVNELLIFALAAFALVITPGPNMLYLISRSLTQGKKAGVISLAGVIGGFVFHILMVSFGLTAILFTIPYAYSVLKLAGVCYLLYLAYQAIKPNGKNIFENRKDLKIDKPLRLFSMGFFTNVLNPKIAMFYLSFFPQFIKPEYGSVFGQSLLLGGTQMTISFMINLFIILIASKAAVWFTENPSWIKIQKWFMAGVLTAIACKMALERGK